MIRPPLLPERDSLPRLELLPLDELPPLLPLLARGGGEEDLPDEPDDGRATRERPELELELRSRDGVALRVRLPD